MENWATAHISPWGFFNQGKPWSGCSLIGAMQMEQKSHWEQKTDCNYDPDLLPLLKLEPQEPDPAKTRLGDLVRSFSALFLGIGDDRAKKSLA